MRRLIVLPGKASTFWGLKLHDFGGNSLIVLAGKATLFKYIKPYDFSGKSSMS
jgi:hypothetical protein